MALKNNSLFNEISGYAPTGGLIGTMLTAIGEFIDDISGLNDKDNEKMVDNLEACKKYDQDKLKGVNVTNQFSRYGDIAQINTNTFVDCGRNLVGMRQFHTRKHYGKDAD